MDEYKLKRQLKKLGNKQFAEDIKVYIKSPYEFYGVRVPELRTLARDYTKNILYKIFISCLINFGNLDIMKKCLWQFMLCNFMSGNLI
jgi:hypothetical protein